MLGGGRVIIGEEQQVLTRLAKLLPNRVRVKTVKHEDHIQVFVRGSWANAYWRGIGNSTGWGGWVGSYMDVGNACREEFEARGLPLPLSFSPTPNCTEALVAALLAVLEATP
jgi:hypothetical protein